MGIRRDPQRLALSSRQVSIDGVTGAKSEHRRNMLRTGSVGRFERDRLAPRIAEIESLRMKSVECGEPDRNRTGFGGGVARSFSLAGSP